MIPHILTQRKKCFKETKLTEWPTTSPDINQKHVSQSKTMFKQKMSLQSNKKCCNLR